MNVMCYVLCTVFFLISILRVCLANIGALSSSAFSLQIHGALLSSVHPPSTVILCYLGNSYFTRELHHLFDD